MKNPWHWIKIGSLSSLPIDFSKSLSQHYPQFCRDQPYSYPFIETTFCELETNVFTYRSPIKTRETIWLPISVRLFSDIETPQLRSYFMVSTWERILYRLRMSVLVLCKMSVWCNGVHDIGDKTRNPQWCY